MEAVAISSRKRLLHVGCGGQPLPDWLSQFEDVRVDIDPDTKPHFVRDMLNLHGLEDFDGVFCCHALEHLYRVPSASPLWWSSSERSKTAAWSLLMVPDLQRMLKPTLEPIGLTCELGPMCGLDLFYGHHARYLRVSLTWPITADSLQSRWFQSSKRQDSAT